MSRLLPLSKGCQYAIRTVAFLSLEPDRKVMTTQKLSSLTRAPSMFLSKILQLLTHAGILRSHRGAVRGYSLGRPAKDISVLDVITACEGRLGHESCLLDERRFCLGGRLCPLHGDRMGVQRKLGRCLAEVSALELGRTFRKRRNGRRSA